MSASTESSGRFLSTDTGFMNILFGEICKCLMKNKMHIWLSVFHMPVFTQLCEHPFFTSGFRCQIPSSRIYISNNTDLPGRAQHRKGAVVWLPGVQGRQMLHIYRLQRGGTSNRVGLTAGQAGAAGNSLASLAWSWFSPGEISCLVLMKGCRGGWMLKARGTNSIWARVVKTTVITTVLCIVCAWRWFRNQTELKKRVEKNVQIQ